MHLPQASLPAGELLQQKQLHALDTFNLKKMREVCETAIVGDFVTIEAGRVLLRACKRQT